MKLSEFLKKKNEITVGYFGGSITEDDKYRKYVNEFLKNTYKENSFTEINAGIGGTTSFLGVHRAERDILSKEPDILFIEFSVNDMAGVDDGDFSIYKRTMEGIVRKTMKLLPETLIVILGLTTEPAINDYFKKGTLAPCVSEHIKVAEHYNIPYINAGKELFCYLEKSGDNVRDYLHDGCHPNDKGGKLYADVVTKFISEYDWDMKEKEPLSENNLENATLLMGKDYENDDWKLSSCTLYGRLPDYIYCYTPGKELEIPFCGSAFGIYCTTEKDSGIIEYSIDGSEWKKVSTWDEYALKFNRAHNYIFEKNLENKKHIAKIRVSENKDELSEGYYIRIGAFFGERG